MWCESSFFWFYLFLFLLLTQLLYLLFFFATQASFFLSSSSTVRIGWAAEMMLSDSPFLFFLNGFHGNPVSSDWGRGSNWPIVSKLHFSEWFPLSSYWNRAPAPLMDTSCHSQFRRREGESINMTPRGSPCSNKEATGPINTQTDFSVARRYTIVCMLRTPFAAIFPFLDLEKSSRSDAPVNTSTLCFGMFI